MTSHDAELSRNMDRITQLQDGIDNLVTIMYSTLSFLSRKADFKQVNPDIPITQSIPADSNPNDRPHETFTQNCEELVEDFMRKAKQIEFLISILPPHPDFNKDSPHTEGSHLQPGSRSSPQMGSTQVNHPNSETTMTESNNSGKEPAKEDEDLKLTATSDREEFERLQEQIHLAQKEYDQALLVAKSLHAEVQAALRQILDQRAQMLASY